MPKYIKIKSATGKGEMVVKRSLIERVEDRDDGGATIHCSDCVYQTASTAAEVLEAMEGKQEVRGTLRIQGNSATVWHHADLSTPSTGTAQRTIEAVVTLCPDLRSELERLTGETWAVRLLPIHANFDENGVFTVRWLFRCFQEKTQFQYALPEHYLSYWVNMSGVAREKWVIESAQAVIAKWRTSSGY